MYQGQSEKNQQRKPFAFIFCYKTKKAFSHMTKPEPSESVL